jgi:hypothetical protein
MNRFRFLLNTVLLGLGIHCPTHAHIVTIQWNDAGRFEHRVTVAPGKFAEACTKLNSGQDVEWAFQASGAADFNIHYHEGRKVEYAAQAKGLKVAEGVLSPTLAQDYCWMWTNLSKQPMELSLRMKKAP